MGAVITGIVVALIGLGALVLGGLQLGGRLPIPRRPGSTSNFSAYMNLVVGIFLIALAVLRIKGLL